MSNTLKEVVRECLENIKYLISCRNIKLEDFKKRVSETDIISKISNFKSFYKVLAKEYFPGIYEEYNYTRNGYISLNVYNRDNLLVLTMDYGRYYGYENSTAQQVFDINNEYQIKILEKLFDNFMQTKEFEDVYKEYTANILGYTSSFINYLRSLTFENFKLNAIFQLLNTYNVDEYIDRFIKVIDNMDEVIAYTSNYSDICEVYNSCKQEDNREKIILSSLLIEEYLGYKTFLFVKKHYSLNFMDYTYRWYCKINDLNFSPMIKLNDSFVKIDATSGRIYINFCKNKTSESKDIHWVDSFKNKLNDSRKYCEIHWTKRNSIKA